MADPSGLGPSGLGPSDLGAKIDALTELVTIRLDSLERRVGGIEDRIGGIEKRVGGIEERVGGIEERVGGIEDRIGGIEERIGGIEERVGGIEERVGGIEGELKQLRTEMHAGFEQAAKERLQFALKLAHLEGRMDEFGARITDLHVLVPTTLAYQPAERGKKSKAAGD